MSDIRLLSAESIKDYVDIAINAYPGFKINTEEERQQLVYSLTNIQNNIPFIHAYGLYRDGKLVGGRLLRDYRMNMLGIEIGVGGAGLLAVDLLHKKEHVARELTDFFLKYYREQNVPIVLIYTFRPDFHYAMNFGYGPKINQYRFRPSGLRKFSTKSHLRFLTAEDKPALMDCYNRYQARTHGMIVRRSPEWDDWFKKLGIESRIVGCMIDGQMAGYLIFGFKPRLAESPMRNDLIIQEFIYHNPAAINELITFLHTQSDQIDRVVFPTHDDTFHYLLLDPRDECESIVHTVYHESNVQGVGLMYRVINVPGLFTALAAHDFNGQSCRLKLTVHDSFFPENAGSTLLYFEQGRVSLPTAGAHDVEIFMNISEFSSLIMGVVDFKRLHSYGLAEISDISYVETVDRLFAVAQKPVCMTLF